MTLDELREKKTADKDEDQGGKPGATELKDLGGEKQRYRPRTSSY